MNTHNNPIDDIYCLKSCGCKGRNEAELCTVKRDCDSCHVPEREFDFSGDLSRFYVDAPTSIPAIVISSNPDQN